MWSFLQSLRHVPLQVVKEIFPILEVLENAVQINLKISNFCSRKTMTSIINKHIIFIYGIRNYYLYLSQEPSALIFPV